MKKDSRSDGVTGAQERGTVKPAKINRMAPPAEILTALTPTSTAGEEQAATPERGAPRTKTPLAQSSPAAVLKNRPQRNRAPLPEFGPAALRERQATRGGTSHVPMVPLGLRGYFALVAAIVGVGTTVAVDDNRIRIAALAFGTLVALVALLVK